LHEEKEKAGKWQKNKTAGSREKFFSIHGICDSYHNGVQA
jgi:hypothetical protein